MKPKYIPFLWIKSDKFLEYRDNPSRVIAIYEEGHALVQSTAIHTNVRVLLDCGEWEYDLDAIRADIASTLTT